LELSTIIDCDAIINRSRCFAAEPRLEGIERRVSRTIVNYGRNSATDVSYVSSLARVIKESAATSAYLLHRLRVVSNS